MAETPVRPLEMMSLTAQSKPARMMEVLLLRPWKTLTEMMLVWYEVSQEFQES